MDDIRFERIVDEALPPENLHVEAMDDETKLTWEAPVEGFIDYVIIKDGVHVDTTRAFSFMDGSLLPGEYSYEVFAKYVECQSAAAGPITARIYPEQIIHLSEGWSGISSCINLQNPDIELLFESIADKLIILQSQAGMFYPGENVNTLINWDARTGYKIKLQNDAEISFRGSMEVDKTLVLVSGRNTIPVLSACDVNVEDLFEGVELILIKEVAGNAVFWPAYGIDDLQTLQPGKAYFVMMNSAAEIVFPECGFKPSSSTPVSESGSSF